MECEWVRVEWSESREGSSRGGKGEEGCVQYEVGTLQPGTSDRCGEHLLAVQESGPSDYDG